MSRKSTSTKSVSINLVEIVFPYLKWEKLSEPTNQNRKEKNVDNRSTRLTLPPEASHRTTKDLGHLPDPANRLERKTSFCFNLNEFRAFKDLRLADKLRERRG